MERRFVLFLVLSFAILIGHAALMRWLNPPKLEERAKAPGVAQPDGEGGGQQQAEKEPRDRQPEPPEKPAPKKPKELPKPPKGPQDKGPKTVARRWGALGSADPDDPYRMLVIWDNRGAAVARVELSSARYRELEDDRRYLGHVVMDETVIAEHDNPKGALVKAVGTRTTAAMAGLEPGDLIVAVGEEKITGPEQFHAALAATAPKESALLTVVRGGEELTLPMWPGVMVQVVGPGTPVARARVVEAPGPPAERKPADPITLMPGDLITAVDGRKVTDYGSFREELAKADPEQTVVLTVVWRGQTEIRGGEPAVKRGQQFAVEVALKNRPLEVIRPESDDPLSFLLTLHQIDGEKIAEDENEEQIRGRPAYLDKELPGLDLRWGNWEVVEAETNQSRVTFRRRLPKRNLVITKTFSLEKVPENEKADPDYPAYHLVLDVKVSNTGDKARKVAYQLDGPTGLPTEGWWYARKFRDVAISKEPGGYDLIRCTKIAGDDFGGAGYDHVVRFIGVDAQYFSAVLIAGEKGEHFAAWQPLRVGRVDDKPTKQLVNTSCRLVSQLREVKPGEEKALARLKIFVGPKRPHLLAEYGLGELIAYGWFGRLARPMSKLLHFFYGLVHNYGIAILMLTVLVRGCMFPLSRKQALGARKMQELQPEIKRIQEKYKKDIEARTKAQQELFRKHNYNPLSGCLVLFIQFPVFIALYRSLMVDIELRQAPLLWEGFPWCSNLSAPDMLFDWSGFMPGFLTDGVGWLFDLGPYFNLLPILTVVLFIVQQKMFMPPATDERSAQQQKIMQYMMVFIGIMFFKVASGLCVYFIASSLWGLAERKFLPKSSSTTEAAKPVSKTEAKAEAKARPEPTPQPSLSGRDGSAARRKKKKSKRGKR